MKYLTMTGFTVRTGSDRWTLGYEGENNSRTLQIKTTDDLTDFATVNLLIDTLDCGAMTVTTVGNFKVLSMVLTAAMLGEAGKKTCQLLMMDSEGTVIKKSNQFQMVVGMSNAIEGTVPDSPVIIIITDYIDDAINERVGDEVLEGKINDWLDDHPEATTTVQDGSLTTAKFQDQSLALLKFKPELSDKFIQNSDCAVSIMGDTALSYIQYTDLSTEISSEFFYDTSGLYNNWGSNPTETIDGKHGISCSPFVMSMLYGVNYEGSAYIDGNNRIDDSMFRDEELREYFHAPNIGAKYLAIYALQNGYAFLPASDFSNVKAGDVIFTTTGDESDTDAPYGINHCEVVGYWINDKKFLVWHGGADAPRPNVRVAQTYHDSVKLCARFPFANQQMHPTNIVNYGEADKSHTVSSSWLVADYGVSENIEANTYYTAIFKMTSVNDIAEQYPTIRDTNNNSLSQSYSGATKKSQNNIYCIPFYSTSVIDKIRLGMVKASDSVSYDSVTVEWMAVVKGIVTKAEEFISPKYEELRNDATLLMSAGKTNAFTPTSGESYASFGNCYYYKIGTRVHVHVGISGLTANTTTTIFNMPTGFIPRSDVVAIGNGDGLTNNAKLSVGSSGNVRVRSESTYALIDIEYDAFQ